MARDRKSSQIRDLEGENRQLAKKVKQLQRDNSRLQKQLDSTGYKSDSKEIDDNEEVYDLQDDSIKSDDRCEKCRSKTRILELGFFKEQKRMLKVCQNADCEHRKVYYE